MEPLKAIRIIEMERTGRGAYRPTGREILMDEDSPLFAMLGASRARETGAMTVEPPMYEDILKIVKEANGDTGTG